MDVLIFILQRPVEGVALFCVGLVVGIVAGFKYKRFALQEKIDHLEEKMKKREEEITELREDLKSCEADLAELQKTAPAPSETSGQNPVPVTPGQSVGGDKVNGKYGEIFSSVLAGSGPPPSSSTAAAKNPLHTGEGLADFMKENLKDVKFTKLDLKKFAALNPKGINSPQLFVHRGSISGGKDYATEKAKAMERLSKQSEFLKKIAAPGTDIKQLTSFLSAEKAGLTEKF